MSILAHALYAAPNFRARIKVLDDHIQHEIKEAKRIKEQLNCSWDEALRIARGKDGQ